MRSDGIGNYLEIQRQMKIMRSDGIGIYLEIQRQMKIMRSDGIGNYLEIQRQMKTMSLKHTSKPYLKRFRTAKKILKTLIVSKACVLMVFETLWNCKENLENVNCF